MATSQNGDIEAATEMTYSKWRQTIQPPE